MVKYKESCIECLDNNGAGCQEGEVPQISNAVNAFAFDNAVEAFDKVHLTLSFSMNEY